MNATINIGLKAAREASDLIIQAWDRPDRLEISEKGRNDFVTDVDVKVEEIIIDQLRKVYPDHGFIGEECGEIEGKDKDTTWVIDPIDGTRNFINGFPHFCISMACIKQGKIEHAIIVDPIKNEEFTASRGSGARLNGQRIRVTKRQAFEGATVSLSCAGLKHYETLLQIQTAMKGVVGAIRMSGSAALDLAYLAAGRTDAGWMSGMHLWDVAAGILIVREAGGLISDARETLTAWKVRIWYSATIAALKTGSNSSQKRLAKYIPEFNFSFLIAEHPSSWWVCPPLPRELH